MRYALLSISLSIATHCVDAADQWPQHMGPNRDGSVAAPGLFDGEIALAELWTVPLGSGYSGVLVGDGKVYTMHVAGAMDALSCFDAATGKMLWSHTYGPSFPKIGSSEPGPLSTPVLDGNRIYGVGGHGELFCLDTSSGKLIWSRDMVKELGTVARVEGVGTSPLISGDLLILNVGDQKDKGIAAFDKRTGVLVWHHGAEPIGFQSPALATLMGRTQVITLSDSKMRGLDPRTGEIIWEKDSKDWLQAYAIGDDLLLTGQYHGFTLHRLNDAGFLKLTDWKASACSGTHEGVAVTEVWNNAYLTIEYDMPVRHQGYLFGFKNTILTCLDLATGARIWSRREDGFGMVTLVDGHLAILGEDGRFRIAPASAKGYEERASIRIFEKSGLSAPSYADRVFYLRNYTHLAAVRVK